MKKIIFIIVFLYLTTFCFSKNCIIPKSKTVDVGEITICSIDKKPINGMVVDKKDREFYKNGKPNGKWITFYENNKIKSIENWKKGFLHGKFILYNRNGIKIFETYYKNGKMNGKYNLYYDDGSPRILGKIKNDKPIKKWKQFKPNI